MGVNSDESRERAIAAAKREDMSWRSFYDMSTERADSIASLWNVEGWPTLRLIDSTGKICPDTGHNEEQLKATIEKLLNGKTAELVPVEQ